MCSSSIHNQTCFMYIPTHFTPLFTPVDYFEADLRYNIILSVNISLYNSER